MALLAILVRPIDVAIFGTLGSLWVLGALFIVALYRWIFRFEREQGSDGSTPAPTPAPTARVAAERRPTPKVAQVAVATARIAHPLR